MTHEWVDREWFIVQVCACCGAARRWCAARNDAEDGRWVYYLANGRRTPTSPECGAPATASRKTRKTRKKVGKRNKQRKKARRR